MIACATPPVRDVAVLVRLARRQGSDMCVITAPYGRGFVDVRP
ncbi:hypothetical protein OG948_02625 [Embleya sp. NBC_00888]|nr:hypothetical protein OG948_02625 [Embleya sp. NBC_00888]